MDISESTVEILRMCCRHPPGVNHYVGHPKITKVMKHSIINVYHTLYIIKNLSITS